ncbi:MAG TPA: tripartite tricarboxylate transporter substrate binding protein [Burkholderiaceae bacterium]|nr:tripartite tricarboxylate transporter substrate binding protein [Burkholderiaceae bacterium]
MNLRSLCTCLAAFALAAAPFASHAADGKPIEWVVGYAAGGGSDIVARTLADAMSKTLNQTIIINNKPGAGTNIAADYAAKSKDYGHLMFTADFATLAANPALYSKLGYNAERDFAPVGLMARFPLILVVSANVPAKNLKEFLAWAKTNANGTNYASPGAGSPHHLATELFRERTKLALTHVPYRGAAPAVQDLIGGQVPFMFVDTASGYQYVQSGKLKAIGVASAQRVKSMSEIPTLIEQGLAGFEAYAWQGLVVPVGAPPEFVANLGKALNAALDSTAVKARFQALGVEPIPSTPQQMASYARTEREKWGQVIRAGNIKLD